MTLDISSTRTSSTSSTQALGMRQMIKSSVEWTEAETGMEGETREMIETAAAMKGRRGGILEKGRAILPETEILTGTPILGRLTTRLPKDLFK